MSLGVMLVEKVLGFMTSRFQGVGLPGGFKRFRT